MIAGKRITPKMLLAVIGGAAIVALGALGMLSGVQTAPLAAHLPPPPPGPVTGAMTLGATVTTTTPLPMEATTMAQPVLKGPAPLPSEDSGLP